MMHSLPALLPVARGFCGPVTRRRVARFLALYAVVLFAGLTLYFYAMDAHLQIFGLGLMMPGGGFLAYADVYSAEGLAHDVSALLGILVFLMSLVLWLATGNAIAPLAAWFGLAVAASAMPHHHIHPAGALTVFLNVTGLSLALLFRAVFMQVLGVKKRKAANKWLASEAKPVAETFNGGMIASPVFSLDDVKRMRFLLDRALQPVERFDGFEWRDQFQTAAIRYQLNFMGFALSMAQATHLPAFGGYLHEAQRRLIEKLTDHRVWSYWALENLWGNLNLNPNPVSHDNIMFTGFCATQMAMYHAASGQRDYDRANSFSLRHSSGRTYDYDLPSLIGVMENEAKRSAFHLIACEPNWIYPLCNTVYASGLQAYAPHVWRAGETHFRENLEHEFIDLQGRIIPCRSNYMGFAVPVVGGAMPQALPCFFLNATMPDIALRQWLLLRRSILDGKRLRRKRFWRIDTGNYGFSRASAYAATALAAAELGDEEIRKLCLEALDEECSLRTDNGLYYRPKASVWSHAVEFFARSTVKNGFRNVCSASQSTGITPHIQKVAYPDVLMAAATYKDGLLKAVMYPGGHGGRQEVAISGLIPDTPYLCNGAEETILLSDAQGGSVIHVMLNGRVELEIYQSM